MADKNRMIDYWKRSVSDKALLEKKIKDTKKLVYVSKKND